MFVRNVLSFLSNVISISYKGDEMKNSFKVKVLNLFLALTMMLGLITIPAKEVKAEVATYVVISEVYGG